jgi:predicted dehydrogenase
VGTLEASRFATGTLDDLRIWIYGERGALHFDLMNPSFLYYYDDYYDDYHDDYHDDEAEAGDYGGSKGWRQLQTVAHYPGALAPPGRAPLGWARLHAENQYRFLRAISSGETPSPGIEDGLRAQLVMDAVERSSADGGSWTAVRSAP